MPFEPTTLGLGAAISAIFASVTLLAEISPPPSGAILVTPEVIEILAHATLRLYCLLGALGGGVLAVLLTGGAGFREMAGKWTVGVLSGLLFTPWIIKVFSIYPSPDYIVAASGAVALLAWGCLHKLLPVLERLVIGRTRKLLGDKSDPSTPPQP